MGLMKAIQTFLAESQPAPVVDPASADLAIHGVVPAKDFQRGLLIRFGRPGKKIKRALELSRAFPYLRITNVSSSCVALSAGRSDPLFSASAAEGENVFPLRRRRDAAWAVAAADSCSDSCCTTTTTTATTTTTTTTTTFTDACSGCGACFS